MACAISAEDDDSAPLLHIPKNPDFMSFRQVKNSLVEELEQQKISPQRLDCMNPPVALSHYLVKPEPDEESPRLSTEAEVMKAWSAATGVSGPLVMTAGVRESLFQSFKYFLGKYGVDNVTFQLPQDTYPKYQLLLNAANPAAKVATFETLGTSFTKGMRFDTEGQCQVTVLAMPLSPGGRWLKDKELKYLCTQLSKAENNYLLLDMVYTFDYEKARTSLQGLMATGKVFACFSMSKGFLSPFLDDPEEIPSKSFGAGFALTPDLENELSLYLAENAHKPSERALGQALTRLEKQPQLPFQLNYRFKKQWDKLKPALLQMDPMWKAPENSYFSTVHGNWTEHLEADNVCVPASVFGSKKEALSVVTCLYDINNDDKERASRTFYHVTALSNFSQAYDKYSSTYDKSKLPRTTFSDKFFLLKKDEIRIGIEKASGLLRKLDLDGDQLVLMETILDDEQLATLEPAESGKGQSVPGTKFVVSNVYLDPKRVAEAHDDLAFHVPILPASKKEQAFCVEEAMAKSLTILKPQLLPYERLQPRTVSVLPIAIGCQAKCPFCFSHSSASADQADKVKTQKLTLDTIKRVLHKAKDASATRAVITGGGEPTMLPNNELQDLVQACGDVYDKVVLITNGYKWGTGMDLKADRDLETKLSADERRYNALTGLRDRGLTVLAVSRHGYDDESNSRIMHLNTGSQKIPATVEEIPGLEMRWICVLQKGGVQDMRTLEKYLTWVASTKVRQVCFKELYVSTSTESKFHNHESNVWSREHQVPLKLILDFCEANDFTKVDQLPWGSPVFEGTFAGQSMQIAAYTEPSLMWERKNGILRSWNLMASGECLASLEDSSSTLCI